MDPVCHTLVGATLGESGLKRRTALGMATLLIAANLPDVDILAYIDGPYTALWFRRGVTHGVAAWFLLPLLLTGGMLLWDRMVRRRGGRVPDRPVVASQLLLLASLGVLTHPLLDLLNTYGIRLFMPLSNTWFFGDTIFIVDVWVWAVLALGIMLQRRWDRRTRRSGRRPAAAALAVVAVYIAMMAASNVAARNLVTKAVVATGLPQPSRLMIAPLPLNPFQRRVVMEVGNRYHVGQWYWLSLRLDLADRVYDTAPTDYGAAAATRGPEVRKFLSWARFPVWETVDGADGRTVYVGDARYTLDARGGSWAAIAVR